MNDLSVNDYINKLKNKGSNQYNKKEVKKEQNVEQNIEQNIEQNQNKKESFVLRKYLNERRDFVKKLNNKVKNERYKQNVEVKEFTSNNEFNEIIKNSQSNDIFKKSWGRLNKELKVMCFKKYMNNITDIDLTAIDKNNLLILLINLQEDKLLNKIIEYNIEEGKIENINSIYFYKIPVINESDNFNIIYEDFRNYFENDIQNISSINQEDYNKLLDNLKSLIRENLDLVYNYFIFHYTIKKEKKNKK